MFRFLRGARSGKWFHPFHVVLLAALILAGGARSAAAQAVYGSIGGTVTDDSGGVLPGVTVTITSTERNTVDTVVTNESGYFTKERCCRARTRSRPSSPASSPRSFRRCRSASTQRRRSLQARLGQMTETYRGHRRVPAAPTDRADVASSFDRKQLTELPVLDRNFTKFILAHALARSSSAGSTRRSENPQGSMQTR